MNTTTRWMAILASAIVIAGALGYALGRRSSTAPVATAEHARAEGAAEDRERKVLYWHDPMVPGARFERPGKSPFMDMDLVPVYADEQSGSEVRIPANVRQNLGIRLGKVEERSLSPQLDAVGNVSFDERRVEVVAARVTGYVTRLYVKAPMEQVRRGQPLAEIFAPEWLAAQEDYVGLLDAQPASNQSASAEPASVQSAAAQAIRAAARQRLVVLGMPEAAIGTLERDRKASPRITVSAPIDGVVTELAMREGAGFAAGMPLVRINGFATVWVNAQIPEARVSLIAPGADVEARTAAWPGVTFKGRMIALLPDVDPQTRTVTARIEIGNQQRKLMPGMFVSLDFTGAAAPPQLVIPSEAVIVTGERSVVIVAREEGAFEVVDVEIGTEADGLSTILSGLQAGQSIVLSGQFLIDSEASLKATLDRLTPAPVPQVRP